MQNNKLLTIALPTFNRAKRLDKALNDLFHLLKDSGYSQYIEVLVSDNGSTDATANTLDQYKALYSSEGFNFSVHRNLKNLGFDANINECYRKSQCQYIWFLSDDDNVKNGAIAEIVESIQNFSPSIILFNFDQEPYTKKSPLILKTLFYKNLQESIEDVINKLYLWPKLSSIVLNRKILISEKIVNIGVLNPGFMHVVLATQATIDFNGHALEASFFIAAPDIDYMDCIDFMPNIGDSLVDIQEEINALNRSKGVVFSELNKKQQPIDVMVECANWLGSFYLGKMSFKIDTLNQLKQYLINNYKLIKFHNLNYTLVFSIIRLILSFLLYKFNMIFLKRKFIRIRE